MKWKKFKLLKMKMYICCMLLVLLSACNAFQQDKDPPEEQPKLQSMTSKDVKGPEVDEHTRCVHYHSEKDVIAIKMKCCGAYYPCIKCHNETTQHAAVVWPKTEFDTKAVLCGMCYHEITIAEYLKCHNQCPNCNAPFNPGCSTHYHLYFEMDGSKG